MDPARGVAEVRRPANKCNGMTYDADLNLIVCEHATSSLVRERPDGRREILASRFEGKELNSPNDVCVRSDGSITFTDPWYGRMPGFGVERPRELGFQGVYRVTPDGALQLLVDRNLFDQPNGLCFSPDEKKLYVNDTEKALIRAFAVATDGSLTGGEVFASGIRSETEPGVPDGMKCDAAGHVWGRRPAASGSLRLRANSWASSAPEERRQSRLGRRVLPHVVPDRDQVGLCGRDQNRPASRALHGRGRRVLAWGLEACRSDISLALLCPRHTPWGSAVSDP